VSSAQLNLLPCNCWLPNSIFKCSRLWTCFSDSDRDI